MGHIVYVLTFLRLLLITNEIKTFGHAHDVQYVNMYVPVHIHIHHS